MPKTELGAMLRYLHGLGGVAETERLTDRELLQRFAVQGDEIAFATLVRRHGPLVLSVCWRHLRHEQDAEDAFQAAFLVLARKAGSVEWQESVASWLHEVACRVSAEARARVARRKAREKQVEQVPEVPVAAEARNDELFTALDRELRRLPEKYRAPLLLCYMEGRTRDEAAEQLGWTVGAVKGCLERGRELLRKRLAARGLTLGAALCPLLLPPATARAPLAVSLMHDTLGLAGAFATGKVGTGTAAMLADAAMRSMALSRLKRFGALLLTLATLGTGAGVLAYQGGTGQESGAVAAQHAGDDLPHAVSLPSVPVLTLDHGAVVRAVGFTPDGKHAASACFDGTVRLWDAATGEPVRQWKTPSLNSALAVSADGRLLAGGNSGGELRVWDLATGVERFVRDTGQGNVYAVEFAPDGRTLATANHRGSISLWDADSGTLLRDLRGHGRRVWSVVFFPNNQTLASAGEDGSVLLWDRASGLLLRQILGHEGEVNSVAVSPNGRLLASGSNDGTVRLWDPAPGREVLRIRTPATFAIRFAREGKTLVTADREGEIHLWEVATGRKLHTLRGHTSAVYSLAPAPDGRRLASSGKDNTARVWSLEPTQQ